MPRDLTHIILADETLHRLSDTLEKGLTAESTAFHMGAVSHDSFLYGPAPKFSTTMHGGFGDDTRAVVLTMLDDVRQEKDPALQAKKKAFTCGFLTHMAADTVFHPFVYSVSGSQVPENNPSEEHIRLAKARHRYAETWLDMHFVDQKGYSFDNFRPLRKIVRNVSDRKALSDFFCKSFQQAYHVKDDLSSAYKRGMMMQLFLGKITRNQTLGKALRRFDELLDGKLKTAVSGFYQQDRYIPAKLENFTSFKHPVTGETVHKTLDDLAEESIVRGAFMIRAAEKYLANGNRQEFLKAVPNTNLDTGIADTKLADIKQASPLPITHLKGTKYKSFMAKGPIKTMACGAENESRRQTRFLHSVKNGRGYDG